MNHDPIKKAVQESLKTYFDDLDETKPSEILSMVIKSVEKSVFEIALERAGKNQSLAAQYLGINRNTLRKKLQEYGLLKS